MPPPLHFRNTQSTECTPFPTAEVTRTPGWLPGGARGGREGSRSTRAGCQALPLRPRPAPEGGGGLLQAKPNLRPSRRVSGHQGATGHFHRFLGPTPGRGDRFDGTPKIPRGVLPTRYHGRSGEPLRAAAFQCTSRGYVPRADPQWTVFPPVHRPEAARAPIRLERSPGRGPRSGTGWRVGGPTTSSPGTQSPLLTLKRPKGKEGGRPSPPPVDVPHAG